MYDVLIVSEHNFGKNLIAAAYLRDLGADCFSVDCAGFEPRPLDPLVAIMMKLEGYDLATCACPYSVFDLVETGQRYDILITVCAKRIDERCPDFPGQRLRLNWRHADPDKIAESRSDRLQQTRIMRDSIKAEVVNFIDEYKEGKFPALC